jgi:hypothetical protein
MSDDLGIVPAHEMVGKRTALQELEAIVRFGTDPDVRVDMLNRWRARWIAEGFIENFVDTEVDKLGPDPAIRIRLQSDHSAISKFGSELLLTQRVVLLQDRGREQMGENHWAYATVISVMAIRAAPRLNNAPRLTLVTT